MTDQPIAHTADGRPLFDNTPTVVVMLVQRRDALLIIRRANRPGAGLLALPGGFHMRGETWQQAGAREVAEETGYVIDPKAIRQIGQVVTDEYGHNLIFGFHTDAVEHDRTRKIEGETMGCMWSLWAGECLEWAFPLHFEAAKARLERIRDEWAFMWGEHK